jgi:hypothetical protein
MTQKGSNPLHNFCLADLVEWLLSMQLFRCSLRNDRLTMKQVLCLSSRYIEIVCV